MISHIAPGDILEYTNPSGGAAIAAGAVVLLGAQDAGCIGVAVTAIAANSAGGKGSVAIEGVFELLATTADDWLAGQKLWWNASTGLTDTAGTNFPAGIAMNAKVATTQLVARVKLLGVPLD